MEISKILRVEANADTDHLETDIEKLAANVVVLGRLSSVEPFEELAFGINPVSDRERLALQSKINKAWDEYTVRLEAWETAFSAGEPVEAQKPVFKEPVNGSSENRVRIAVQAWLKVGGKIPEWVPPTPTAEQIKAEAALRILEVAPEWYQRNITARAAELALKGADNWTAEEQAEVAAGQAVWDKIKGIRAASSALETMDPRPSDFATNEAYWSA